MCAGVLRAAVILAVIAVSICLTAAMPRVSTSKHSVKPKAGFVPDATTAVRIAEAVCIPIYGQAVVENERPFSASLKGETWTVTGFLPKGMDGGVAIVELRKADARILRVSHGK